LIVVWTEAALRQLAEIFDYWDALNPTAAGEIYDRLLEAGNKLARMPHRGRGVSDNRYRELVVIRPYAIRYRADETAVYILRVRHTSRRTTRR